MALLGSDWSAFFERLDWVGQGWRLNLQVINEFSHDLSGVSDVWILFQEIGVIFITQRYLPQIACSWVTVRIDVRMGVLMRVLGLAFVGAPFLATLAGGKRRQLPVVWNAHAVLKANLFMLTHRLVRKFILSSSHADVLLSVIFAKFGQGHFRNLNPSVGIDASS